MPPDSKKKPKHNNKNALRMQRFNADKADTQAKKALDAERSAHDATKMALDDTQSINAVLEDELSDRTQLLSLTISTIGNLNKRLLATKYHGAQLARHHLQTVLATRAQSRAQDEASS